MPSVRCSKSRENPAWNRSGLITQMEFHGNVQGRILQEYGMPGVSDELRDYRIDAYCHRIPCDQGAICRPPRAPDTTTSSHRSRKCQGRRSATGWWT